jgi:hypothetical protein
MSWGTLNPMAGIVDFGRRALGATQGATDLKSWGSNLGDSYKSTWNDIAGFAKNPMGAIGDFFNPAPVTQEAPGAIAARERAAGYVPGSQQGFMDMMNQGSQAVNPMQAAQVDPNAFMQSWQGAQQGLMDNSFAATSPYAQAMNQVAQRQSALGSEAALAAMPGARNSGAGMAAFGQAYADPFAQAQVAQQQMATGLYGQLSGQAMGQYGQNHLQNTGWDQQARLQNQAMEEAWRQRQLQAGSQQSANALGWGNIESGLASDMNVIYQPPSGWDYLKDGIGMASNIGSLMAGA